MSNSSQNPYQPQQHHRFGPDDQGPVRPTNPGKLVAPAIALVVCGIFDFLYGVLNLITNLYPQDPVDMPANLEGNELAEQFFAGMNDPDPTIGIIVSVVMLLMAMLLVAGAIAMINRKMYPLAIGAAVVAIVPCAFMDCCVLEIAFGIWAMVVLVSADIRAIYP